MDITFGQWGRLLWWLGQGQNAAAVQALSAVATVMLTGLIAFVTWKYVSLTGKYVNLTRAAVDLTKAGFQAEMHPKLAFSLGEPAGDLVNFTASIRNAGSRPIRIISLGVFCFDVKNAEPLFPRMELDNYRDVTLAPSDQLPVVVSAELILKLSDFGNRSDATTWVTVWCCDIANSADHTFVYRTESGDVLYFPGPIQWKAVEERFKRAHRSR